MKKIILIGLLMVLLSSFVSALDELTPYNGFLTIDSDDFNRVNSNSLGTTDKGIATYNEFEVNDENVTIFENMAVSDGAQFAGSASGTGFSINSSSPFNYTKILFMRNGSVINDVGDPHNLHHYWLRFYNKTDGEIESIFIGYAAPNGWRTDDENIGVDLNNFSIWYELRFNITSSNTWSFWVNASGPEGVSGTGNIDNDIDEGIYKIVMYSASDITAPDTTHDRFFIDEWLIMEELTNFKITATDNITSSAINSFSANVGTTPYTTTNGTIVVDLFKNDTSTHDISVWSDSHYNNSYLEYNLTNNLPAVVNPFYTLNFLNYSGFILNSGFNYTNNLTFNLNYTCISTSTSFIDIFIDNVTTTYATPNCTNSSQILPSSYIHSSEGYYNIFFSLNGTNAGNATYISDLYSPIVSFVGFKALLNFTELYGNVTMTCRDNVFSTLTYNLTVNNEQTVYANFTNNTDISVHRPIVYGDNNISTSCSDLFFTSSNQTVFSQSDIDSVNHLDNCTNSFGYTNATTLNFTIFDEDFDQQLISDVDMVISFLDFDKNFTFTLTNDTFKVCLYPDYGSVQTDIFLEYEPTSGNGYKERYYIVNTSLSNVTKFVNLYNFNTTATSTVLEGTAKDFDSEVAFPNLIAKLLRFYPADNEWKLVQVDRTDNFGKFFFYIKERDTLYNVIFEEDNLELKRTSELKFQCDVITGLCEVIFLVPTASAVIGTSEITFDIDFNEDTSIITVFWNDPKLLTSGVRVEITKNVPNGRLTLFNQTSTSQTGSFTYDATGQEGTLVVKAYASSSPEYAKAIEYINMLSRKLWEIIDDNKSGGKFAAGFWSVGIMLTAVGATLWAPGAALIGLFLAAIITFFITGMNFITYSFLASMAIGMIIIMIKVKK